MVRSRQPESDGGKDFKDRKRLVTGKFEKDSAYFGSVFKKFKKMSPKEYRMKIMNK